MRKAATRSTADGKAAHSLRALLDYLSSLTLNRVALAGNLDHVFAVAADNSAPARKRAVELLGFDPAGMLPADIQVD